MLCLELSKYRRKRLSSILSCCHTGKSVSLTAPYVIVVVIVVVVPVAITKIHVNPVVVGAIHGAKLFFH